MKINYQYKPFKYYFVTLLFTWISLFAAAYCSHTEGLESYTVPLIIPASFAPFVIAMFMIYGSKNKELKKDFKASVTSTL